MSIQILNVTKNKIMSWFSRKQPEPKSPKNDFDVLNQHGYELKQDSLV